MFSKHKKNKEGHGISFENFNTISGSNISSLCKAGMLFMWGCNMIGNCSLWIIDYRNWIALNYQFISDM